MAKKKLTLEEKMEEAIVTDVPYEVPGNWVWTTFDKIVNINPKKVDVKKLDDSVECSFIPMNIVDNEFGIIHETEIKRLGEVKKGYTNFIEGDVIFAKITPCMENRKSAIVPKLKNDLGYGSTEFHVLRTDSKYVDNRYIFYFIRSHEFISDATAAMTGAVGQQRVQKSFIEGYKVPFPPLKDQQRIVYRIESLFEKLDKAKELIEEAREGFEKRKSAYMYKILDMNASPQIPLNTCVKFVTEKKEPEDGDVYIGLENMKRASGITSYGIAEDVKSTKTKFKTGDVLYGRLRPYLNKHDVVDRDGICSTDILVMRPNNGYNSRYINYMLDTLEFIKYSNENSSGINLPRVSSKIVGEYLISNINLDTQIKVVKIFDDLYQKEREIEELTQLEEQIELIKKSILAKAFRGELGTNSEEDESALELLKEILSKS